jgi:hypothetical protein
MDNTNMSKEYRILSFNPELATMVIQFRGHWPYNYSAPIVAGSYLDGVAFEAWVQSLYPYTNEERLVLAIGVTGAESIQARISAEQFELPAE